MSAEPVAWRTYRVVTDDWHYHNFPYKLDLTCQPLYTRKKPLSDEEAHVLCQNRILLGGTLLDLLRDVEKEHGIGVDDE